MGGFLEVLDDIDCMALYWQGRKMDFLVPASTEFTDCINPMPDCADGFSPARTVMLNTCFTEWALFERPLAKGRTPLELFVEQRPVARPKKSWKRLRQVAETQFFSRFAIAGKHRKSGICTLEDMCTGSRYEVFDECLSSIDRWRDGTIGMRIACVDGEWLTVGHVHLYDVATPEATREDGPGAIHPEERDSLPPLMLESFYLRLVHDTMGADGRYAATAHIRDVA